MNKKNFYLLKINAFIITLLCIINLSIVLADDTTGNTYYDTSNAGSLAQYANGTQWGVSDKRWRQLYRYSIHNRL